MGTGPLARELVIAASEYRVPVDDAAIMWQLTDESESSTDPDHPAGVRRPQSTVEALKTANSSELLTHTDRGARGDDLDTYEAARRDSAPPQQLVDLHGPVLRQHEQKVCDLRRLHERRRIDQHLAERTTPRLEVALELRAMPAHYVGPPKRVLALHKRSRRGHPPRRTFTVL